MNLIEEKTTMMFNYIFILEAKNDVVFLKDFILENYKNYGILKAKAEDEFWLKNNDKIINIRSTKSDESKSGGWNNFENLVKTANFHKMLSPITKVIVVFDADEDKIQNINHKKNEITKWIDNKFEFDTFFIPFNDNKSIDLEQLLELCFSKKEFVECYNNLKKCVLEKDNLQISKNKGMIVTYRENYTNNNQGYSLDYWKINAGTNTALKTLKNFLDQYLN